MRQAKKNKVHLVFDSTASYKGTSLNEELLPGPDLCNKLRSVLTRFRNGEIGFCADIESMFHAFYLPVQHKDYTRFFWWKNNDTNEELVEYRAKVHIFGNRSSPASANVGLRYAASTSSCSKEVIQFVNHNFYVDDGCGCADTAEEAIALLSQTCEALKKCNIRLHKISSSSTKVPEAFPASERSQTSPLNSWPGSSQPTIGIE